MDIFYMMYVWMYRWVEVVRFEIIVCMYLLVKWLED